jgi:MYXO-CTERM domain-containing protein
VGAAVKTERFLDLRLSNGFSVAIDAITPEEVHAVIESHVCYYSYGFSRLSHCTFTLTFEQPEPAGPADPAPEPGVVSLGIGVLGLAVLARRRRRYAASVL